MSERSGAEIQEALRAFVERWSGYAGSEIAQAPGRLSAVSSCSGVVAFREKNAATEEVALGVGFRRRRAFGFERNAW